jgi:subtilisin family serine protease/PKD repeat protein
MWFPHRSVGATWLATSQVLFPLSPALPQGPRAAADLTVVGPALAAVERPTFVDAQLIVRHGATRTAAEIAGLEAELGLARLRQIEALGVVLYQLPPALTVAEGLRRLRGDPRIDFVEQNGLSYLHQVPNDGFYDNYNGVLTDLQKWVYAGIGADTNLDGELAWDLTTGRSDVVIAIIDTGVELNHPDLAPNLWVNLGEIAGNGVDDDGNGFVDDVHGFDFRNNDANPNPDYGDGFDNDGNGAADDGTFHGTFSASCAAARGNDGLGMAGAAWNCRIMAVKIFTDDGGASTFDIADGIVYAAQNGADVSNMSFGGGFSSTVQSAVNFAWGQGVVQVASAGNSNSSAAQYPASLLHVISVGASDSGSVLGGGSGDLDGRAFFSQYGTTAVDVVAPGHQLVGAAVGSVAGGDAGQDYWILSSGTSFSAPIVSGLAALVISRARDLGTTLTASDVEAIVQSTANNLPDDTGDSPNGGATWDGQGRVDFLAAVSAVTGGGSNQPPVAAAGPDQSGLVGQAIAFSGSGSSDPDGPLVSYTWNFGDGTGGSGVNVSHVYSTPGVYTVTLTVGDGSLTDDDTALVTISAPPSGGPHYYLSSSGTNTVAGIGTVNDEDVVRYDPTTGLFTVYFDGSDVGLSSAAIDALHVEPSGDLLLSFVDSFAVPGLTGGPSGTTADDSDLVRFTPSSTGANTAGVFSFVFDGSDVGLTTNDEDLDAVAVASNGDLLISILGAGAANGASSLQDEDVIRFAATALGSVTAGNFTLVFDGSDVGLSTSSNEDVDGLDAEGSGTLYLSTLGNFSVTGLSGGDEDAFRFVGTLSSSTSGSFSAFFDGSAAGLPGNWDVTGFSIR